MNYIKQENLLPDAERQCMTITVTVQLENQTTVSLEFEPSHRGKSNQKEIIERWKSQFYKLPYIIITYDKMVKVTEDNFSTVLFNSYNANR